MSGQGRKDQVTLRARPDLYGIETLSAHYQKQSSMWSNNKACLAQVEGNVVFNGPRVRHSASSY